MNQLRRRNQTQSQSADTTAYDDCTISLRMNKQALLILERGLMALGDVGEDVQTVLVVIRGMIPTKEFVDDAAEIMQPTSLTAKLEARLRSLGIETTVWCPNASHGEYTYQAIGAGNNSYDLADLSDFLSRCSELGPIRCERTGKYGEHLLLHLAVNGGGM